MWNQDLYKRALDFAAAAHGEQKDPGNGFPYVVHLVKVAGEVLCAHGGEAGFDVDLAMQCGLLHDCLEDAGVSRERLEREFGAKVAAGVQALTKDEAVPKPQRMADSLARIRAQPREVWTVKLADRISNLEPPPRHWTVEKRKAYRAEAGEILAALREASAPLAARLEQKMREYEQHCR